MVSTRTVAPDLMRRTAGARAEIYPQTTVSGVEPKVASGLFPAGAGCAAANTTEANVPSTAHHSTSDLETCSHIETALFINFFSTDCFDMIVFEPNPDRKFAGAQEHNRAEVHKSSTRFRSPLTCKSCDQRLGQRTTQPV